MSADLTSTIDKFSDADPTYSPFNAGGEERP
jgi:hypothetical protein